ncbi:hypothetical protein V1523DRAFT_262170 [Lipomyces doorenjongii]
MPLLDSLYNYRRTSKNISSLDGRPLKSCQRCRANKSTKTKNTPFTRTGFDLDEYYQTHEDFIESVSSFLELNDNHIADADLQSLRIKAILAPDLRYVHDVLRRRYGFAETRGDTPSE